MGAERRVYEMDPAVERAVEGFRLALSEAGVGFSVSPWVRGGGELSHVTVADGGGAMIAFPDGDGGWYSVGGGDEAD